MTDSTEISALPSQSGGIPSQPTHNMPQQPQQQPQGPPPAVETQQKEQLIAPQYNPGMEGLNNGPIQATQPQPQQQQQQQQQPQPGANIHTTPNNVPPTEPLSQEVVDQLIKGVQRAQETGATRLQSKDIPQDPTQVTLDQQQKTDHVPHQGINEAPGEDYIQQMNNIETMISEKQKNANKEETLNQFYDEIQTPILIVVLFFLFQLPFTQQKIRLYLPSLFINNKATLGAYIVQAVMFGSVYYSIKQLISILSN